MRKTDISFWDCETLVSSLYITPRFSVNSFSSVFTKAVSHIHKLVHLSFRSWAWKQIDRIMRKTNIYSGLHLMQALVFEATRLLPLLPPFPFVLLLVYETLNPLQWMYQAGIWIINLEWTRKFKQCSERHYQPFLTLMLI